MKTISRAYQELGARRDTPVICTVETPVQPGNRIEPNYQRWLSSHATRLLESPIVVLTDAITPPNSADLVFTTSVADRTGLHASAREVSTSGACVISINLKTNASRASYEARIR